MSNWLKTAFISGLLLLTGCEKASYQTLAGEQGHFEALQEQWLVINYWASWCTPCREEIPELNHFSRQFQQQARVLAVNFDNLQGQALVDAAGDMDIQFDSLLRDPSLQLGFPRPEVLPTTMIIAPGGEVVQALSGPQTLPSLAKAIQQEIPNG